MQAHNPEAEEREQREYPLMRSPAAIAGWVVAVVAILTALINVSSRAGSVEQRVTQLEMARERDNVKLDHLLDSVARIESQLQRRQIEVDSSKQRGVE